MRNRSLVAIELLLFVSLGASAMASSSIDQQQPTIDVTVGGLAIGGASEQKLAQVVTAGTSGALTEVRLPISCSSGNLIVEIQGVSGGVPNGVILTSQSIPGSSLPSYFPIPGVVSFRSLALSTPVSFAVGNQFAIVLSSSGSCGIFQGPIGDSYPGGNAYFDSRPNAAGIWVCICEFAGSRFDLPFQTIVEEPIVQVEIDVRPATFPNSINPNSRGTIPVAVLTTPDFDATVINRSTIRFGTTGSEATPVNSYMQDVDRDGDTDLTFHFAAEDTGIACGHNSASVTGRTYQGQAIKGSDSIITVGCASPIPTSYTFTTIDGPGSTFTAATNINNIGQIVGGYTHGVSSDGFLAKGDTFTMISLPGSRFTSADAINNHSQIVGAYFDGVKLRTFLLNDGTFSTIDIPESTFTIPGGINDRGQIVGTYSDGSKTRGFLLENGTFTMFEFPGSNWTQPGGINNHGHIVGAYREGTNWHGFTLRHGVFTSFDVPGSTSLSVGDINDRGQIVGTYSDGVKTHGFLLDDMTFTTVDVPGSTLTRLFGINDHGQIVGSYMEGATTHAFKAEP